MRSVKVITPSITEGRRIALCQIRVPTSSSMIMMLMVACIIDVKTMNLWTTATVHMKRTSAADAE